MNYELIIWFEDDIDSPPVMEAQLTVDENLDKETRNVIKSNMRIAFEIMYNQRMIVEFHERQTPLCLN